MAAFPKRRGGVGRTLGKQAPALCRPPFLKTEKWKNAVSAGKQSLAGGTILAQSEIAEDVAGIATTELFFLRDLK